ncbi:MULTISPECIES: hypothetical protein [Pirellulaceae]|uniref:hypothetical protein n=1 Tax=Pirellulaceae TaxID=2691357 RepID=UPI0011B0A402|nr:MULTISPECIES: hypothetical protein [Pirellulaceae]
MSHPHETPESERYPTPYADHIRKIGEDLLEEIRQADLEIERLEAEIAALQKAQETKERTPPPLDSLDQEMHEAIQQRPSVPRFRVDAHGNFTRREESFNNLRPKTIDVDAILTRSLPTQESPPNKKTPHPNPLPAGARGPERGHTADCRRVSRSKQHQIPQPSPHPTPPRGPRSSLPGRAKQRQAVPPPDPAAKLRARAGLRRPAHQPFPLTRLPIAAETATLNRIDFL